MSSTLLCRATLSAALIVPMAFGTGCSSGRMALAAGLHTTPASDQAVLATVNAAPADVTPERHARMVQPIQSKPELMELQLSTMKPGTENTEFVSDEDLKPTPQ